MPQVDQSPLTASMEHHCSTNWLAPSVYRRNLPSSGLNCVRFSREPEFWLPFFLPISFCRAVSNRPQSGLASESFGQHSCPYLIPAIIPDIPKTIYIPCAGHVDRRINAFVTNHL